MPEIVHRMLFPPETCAAREIGRYRIQQDTIGAKLEYLIKQYPLDTGALEIQYIEEFFGEFPRKKTAQEIMNRLRHRESLILMAEAPLPADPGLVVPVSFKIVHELR